MLRPALRVFAAIVATLALLSSAAFSPAGAQEEDAERLKVVTTFSILEDIVANVGGDAIDLETLVPAGGDAHTFDPAPDQVSGVSDADVIVQIGVDFEPWLADMIEASGSDATQVVVTDGLDLIEHTDEGHEDEGEEDHEDHEGHDHPVDPHVWGDVRNVIAITATVKDALIAADPANSASYEANATAYTAQLEELDQWVKDEVDKLPEDRRKLVTSHDTFGYLARAYGFEMVGTALGSVTTESGDPSAREIADLVAAIKDAGVTAIFPENVANSDLIDVIAAEAGVEVGPPLYTDALGEPGSDGDTYIRLMTYNVTSIVSALSA
jgi:zinc/manganese transport system substrate-binding protein